MRIRSIGRVMRAGRQARGTICSMAVSGAYLAHEEEEDEDDPPTTRALPPMSAAT